MLYIVGIFFIYIFINFIAFTPVRHTSSTKYNLSSSFKEFKLKHPNEEQINVLYFKSSIPTKATVLFLHGARQSADAWAAYVPAFTERGLNVVIPDYRGYGKSYGNPSEINWYEDGQLTYSWLKTRMHEDSIIIYGAGLGTAVASYLATLNPARFVILENPIYGLRNWIRSHYPALLLPYELKYDFNVYEYLPNSISPTYILQSNRSRECTPEEAIQLQQLLTDPNNLIPIDQEQNVDIYETTDYTKFLDQLAKVL